MMSTENPSSWVPDRLPDFRSKMLPITVADQALARETRTLARLLHTDPKELCRTFISLGVLAADIDRNPAEVLIERDSLGREAQVSLMTNQPSAKEIQQPQIKIGPISIAWHRDMIFHMPGELGDLFMDIANRHHTTVDEVLRHMFILGIRMSKAKHSADRTYIIREDGKNDQELTF